MANEFIHTDVGGVLTEAEYDALTAHSFNSQATGDLLYASSASQLTRLGIGSTNAVLVVSGGIPSWSATLAGLTLTAPVINGAVTTTGLTMPVFTASDIFGASSSANVQISGGNNFSGTGATISIRGHANGGGFDFYTTNAAGSALVTILTIVGAAATATATWASITHINFNLGDYLGVWKTDVDSSVEAELWYDDSENVLKFYNGTTVKTIATV